MKPLSSGFSKLAADESGQDLVEYALIAALVGLGAIASLKDVRQSVGAVFTAVGTNLTSNV